MGSLIYFLIFGALFFVMMRYGCGAHVTGHGSGSSGAHSDSRDAVAGPAVDLAASPELAEDPRQLKVRLRAHRAHVQALRMWVEQIARQARENGDELSEINEKLSILGVAV